MVYLLRGAYPKRRLVMRLKHDKFSYGHSRLLIECVGRFDTGREDFEVTSADLYRYQSRKLAWRLSTTLLDPKAVTISPKSTLTSKEPFKNSHFLLIFDRSVIFEHNHAASLGTWGYERYWSHFTTRTSVDSLQLHQWHQNAYTQPVEIKLLSRRKAACCLSISFVPSTHSTPTP